MNKKFKFYNRQKGSVLVLSIVILSVITMGALVTMKRSTLQVRMTTNTQFHVDAFQSAMNSLVVVERNLAAGASQGLSDLVDLESADEDDLGVVSLDLYDVENWTPPTATNSKIITNVTSKATVGDLPAPSGTTAPNLKENSGNSANSVAMYTFIIEAAASDKTGNIVSTQQIAIRRPGPST